jgi:hypothetical protein
MSKKQPLNACQKRKEKPTFFVPLATDFWKDKYPFELDVHRLTYYVVDILLFLKMNRQRRRERRSSRGGTDLIKKLQI